MATVAFATASLASATYVVDKDELIITWGRVRHTLALQQIAGTRVVTGPVAVTHFRGVRWPGLLVGRGRLSAEPDGKAARFYCSNSAGRLLLVSGGAVPIVISPADPEGMAALLAAKADQAERPVEAVNGEWRAPAVFTSSIWSDRSAQVLIALGLALSALLFAVLAARFASLPPLVPLRVGEDAMVAVSGPPSWLFLLPALSFATWVVNGIVGFLFYEKRHDYLEAYLLWGATVVVAATAIVAVATLLS
jgi:hypothetical protein